MKANELLIVLLIKAQPSAKQGKHSAGS